MPSAFARSAPAHKQNRHVRQQIPQTGVSRRAILNTAGAEESLSKGEWQKDQVVQAIRNRVDAMADPAATQSQNLVTDKAKEDNESRCNRK